MITENKENKEKQIEYFLLITLGVLSVIIGIFSYLRLKELKQTEPSLFQKPSQEVSEKLEEDTTSQMLKEIEEIEIKDIDQEFQEISNELNYL